MGFWIESPQTLVRQLFSFFGHIIICAAFRSIAHYRMFRRVPLRLRPYVTHVTWGLMQVWFFVFMVHEALQSMWMWLQVAYIVVDVMWQVEHEKKHARVLVQLASVLALIMWFCKPLTMFIVDVIMVFASCVALIYV